MEKNLPEHSSSFSHKDDDNNNNNISEDNVVVVVDDASDGKALSEPTTENVEKDEEIVKKEEGENSNEEIKKAQEDDVVADIEGEDKEKKEEEVVADVPPETPPPKLEKISEDIDAFIINEGTISSKEPNFIHRFLDLVEEKISGYDTGKIKWGESKEEDSLLLEAIDRISKLMKLIPNSPPLSTQSEEEETEEINAKQVNDSLLKNRVGAIHQQAMSYLEDEFRVLLEEPKNHVTEPESNKHDSKGKQVVEPQPLESEPGSNPVPKFPNYGDETISNLNNIAMKMISGGYQSECFNMYFISRRHGFEENLHKLGLEKISIDEVHKMQWEALEREIPTWNNVFKECISIYFAGEKKLAEAVFSDNPNMAASVFMMVCQRVVIQLINFAEAVAMTKRAGEKLFKLLDMYETLRDLIANLDNLFPEECVDELKAETTSAKCRLGESSIVIFCELENSIKSDIGKTPVAGGAVHPLTRYIMNYLRLACEYKDTLEEVFKEHSKIERADSTSRPHYEAENKNENEKRENNDNNKDNVSPFAAQLMRVMELLDTNLEGKAKLYKDAALSSIFMMNNGRYIVQKIKGSPDLYEVMGETWYRKRSSNLRTYHKNYQIETWSKILGCLSPKGLNDSGKVQKPVLKERFKSFNALFEEIHKTQSTWVVSDEQLQSELRVSISALVIPAYRSFLGRFSQYLDPGRQTGKYIKFQAEDIETYIDELFDGNPHHQSLAKKRA
ncbi:hypothetical protein Lal_00038156 [Lupinus albus]|uniref:Exocyst subunit Exo70 family protein n=1 Tax=Lupinus albus TaxID=3870 RepID=A0A6A5MW86_LUPAL|nr:putative exocyst complex component Exo70, cullin repeat-like-containing domain-containing protein [Lupinus albus]KAF1877847.1 hypothetical protein Lal_00038156 [Lupinus albus]